MLGFRTKGSFRTSTTKARRRRKAGPDTPASLSQVARLSKLAPRARGPGSDASGGDEHSVTPIAYEDAEAYAWWAGKALPTEVEWERLRIGLAATREP